MDVSRREFRVGVVVGAIAALWPFRLLARSTTISTAVTPEFAVLGDKAHELLRAYWHRASLLTVAQRFGTCQDVRQEDVLFRSARAKLWRHQLRLLRRPAQSRGDVILKYHVIDTAIDVDLARDETAFEPGGFIAWCEMLVRDAERFNVPIAINAPYAEINGVRDRTKSEWQDIARWTT